MCFSPSRSSLSLSPSLPLQLPYSRFSSCHPLLVPLHELKFLQSVFFPSSITPVDSPPNFLSFISITICLFIYLTSFPSFIISYLHLSLTITYLLFLSLFCFLLTRFSPCLIFPSAVSLVLPLFPRPSLSFPLPSPFSSPSTYVHFILSGDYLPFPSLSSYDHPVPFHNLYETLT